MAYSLMIMLFLTPIVLRIRLLFTAYSPRIPLFLTLILLRLYSVSWCAPGKF